MGTAGGPEQRPGMTGNGADGPSAEQIAAAAAISRRADQCREERRRGPTHAGCGAKIKHRQRELAAARTPVWTVTAREIEW